MTQNEIRTPAFVFDVDKLRARAAYIGALFGPRFEVCYAVKANPFLVRALHDSVSCFEVCSTGEFRICERAGIKPEKIVLSGVYKEADDMKRIVAQCSDKTLYTIESSRGWQ